MISTTDGGTCGERGSDGTGGGGINGPCGSVGDLGGGGGGNNGEEGTDGGGTGGGHAAKGYLCKIKRAVAAMPVAVLTAQMVAMAREERCLRGTHNQFSSSLRGSCSSCAMRSMRAARRESLLATIGKLRK